VSHGVGRTNAGAAQWRPPAPARALRLISLATALQGLVSDPGRCLNWNSPHTGVIKIATSTCCGPSRPDSQLPNSVLRSSGTVLAIAIATASLGVTTSRFMRLCLRFNCSREGRYSCLLPGHECVCNCDLACFAIPFSDHQLGARATLCYQRC
jgi:hypothetical protein